MSFAALSKTDPQMIITWCQWSQWCQTDPHKPVFATTDNHECKRLEFRMRSLCQSESQHSATIGTHRPIGRV
jgi:hypothetical protein